MLYAGIIQALCEFERLLHGIGGSEYILLRNLAVYYQTQPVSFRWHRYNPGRTKFGGEKRLVETVGELDEDDVSLYVTLDNYAGVA